MTDQKILNNAPEGATHVDSDGDYWLITEETQSMTFLFGKWNYCEPQGILPLRSLEDIRKIAELENNQAIRDLEQQAKGCGDAIVAVDKNRPFRLWYTHEIDAQKYWTKGYEDCLKEMEYRAKALKEKGSA